VHLKLNIIRHIWKLKFFIMKKLLLVLSVFLSVSVMAQNTGNKIKFQKGQKLEVVTETRKNASAELMGQSMETKANSIFTESFDIEDVTENGATIEYKVKRLQVDISMMGREDSFDSEKEGDRQGEMGKAVEKGLKNKYTMKVDQFGKILSVKADDDNPNVAKPSQQEEGVNAMLAQFGISFSIPKEGDQSIFKILPDKTVATGDVWNNDTNVDGQKRSTVYKVNSINDADIIIDLTEDVTINTKQQMMGTEADVTGSEKGTGTITLDKNSGLLKTKTFSSEGKTTMEAQGMSIPTTVKSTVKVLVTIKN
jgi:hypothetical protein